jgi:hypothetical protein
LIVLSQVDNLTSLSLLKWLNEIEMANAAEAVHDGRIQAARLIACAAGIALSSPNVQ